MKTSRVLEILKADGYTPRGTEKAVPHSKKHVDVVVFKHKEYMLLNITQSNLKLFENVYDAVCHSIQEIKNYMKKVKEDDDFKHWQDTVKWGIHK